MIRIKKENTLFSLRWHYPNQVTGQSATHLISADLRSAPQVFKLVFRNTMLLYSSRFVLSSIFLLKKDCEYGIMNSTLLNSLTKFALMGK